MEHKIFKPEQKDSDLIVENLAVGIVVINIFSIAGGKFEIVVITFAAIGLAVSAIMMVFAIATVISFFNAITRNKSDVSNIRLHSVRRYKLLQLTRFLFSEKTQREVFLPVMADWDREIFNAAKSKVNNDLMIHTRNAYAFFSTMMRKTPLGDFIEFIIRIFK